ncbi:MAG TPA: helicase-associated domain-containing protein [Sporichthyaceae bacterium]|jgi:hypothetical protein|nr:helicase-associated domain-containing protein [Sporichthyaceae bacterium]
MSTVENGRPRTLADDLRGRSDAELEALFGHRPDLLAPVPADMTALVARATTRLSLLRALDRLDRFTLQVLDALSFAGDPARPADLARLVPAPAADLDRAVAALRETALVWGDPEELHVVRAVREVLGTSPGGTGPPLAAALAGFPPGRLQHLLGELGLPGTPDPPSALECLRETLGETESLARLLTSAPPGALELLDKVDAVGNGVVGRIDRAPTGAESGAALEWLLARGVLIALNADTVVLPAEVGVARRGGALYPHAQVAPPTPAPVEVGVKVADAAGVGQVMNTVRQVEQLLEAWSLDPPGVLRSGGGLGVRDLKRVQTLLDAEPAQAAATIELAYVTGLVAAEDHDAGLYLPTPGYDQWLAAGTAGRWTQLVQAWLRTSRVAALVGTRTDVGGPRDRPLPALGADLDRAWAPGLRRATIEELAALPNGTKATAADVLARLAWRAPRRTGVLHEVFVRATLNDAARLGVTGSGALTTFGRAVLDDDPAGATARLERALPDPVEQVLIQADLTAVAPGPLRRDLATELGLVAEVESTGAATVYRFTDASVRRALDAGRSAAEVHEFLAGVSRTPVPQPLSYLVDDVARRHGRIRVGNAGSYLRCDDAGVVNELLAHRGTVLLGLRRLAPTVLAAEVAPESLLARLRELGYAPMTESAVGTVIVTRPNVRRTGRRSPPRPVAAGLTPAPGLATAAVRALRAGDRAAATGRRVAAEAIGSISTGSATHGGSLGLTLERLRTAVSSGASVWVEYVGEDGTASERIVDPLALDGGLLSAYDHRMAKVRYFKVSHIRAVADA